MPIEPITPHVEKGQTPCPFCGYVRDVMPVWVKPFAVFTWGERKYRIVTGIGSTNIGTPGLGHHFRDYVRAEPIDKPWEGLPTVMPCEKREVARALASLYELPEFTPAHLREAVFIDGP